MVFGVHRLDALFGGPRAHVRRAARHDGGRLGALYPNRRRARGRSGANAGAAWHSRESPRRRHRRLNGLDAALGVLLWARTRGRRAAREAIGPDVELMLDCNNGWIDTVQAMQHMSRIEQYDPYFIEEPFGPDDIESHARLAKLTRIPVATAEIGYGRWYHKQLLEAGAAAILQTDAAVCGGITEWKRIAAIAAGYGVQVCPHWFHDVHAPLVAATPNARYVEFFWDDQVLNFRRLVDRQLDHRSGRVILHQTPGLGFAFDEKQVAKYGRWTTVASNGARLVAAV